MKLRLKKSHYIIIGIYILIAAIAGYIFYLHSYRPADYLGTKLEYIGKRDHGCLIFCPSPPFSSVYYYATDMSEDEVKGYFKEADFQEDDTPVRSSGGPSNTTWLEFETTRGDFVVRYYHNPQAVKDAYASQFERTDKPNIVSISEFDYDQAKEGLGE